MVMHGVNSELGTTNPFKIVASIFIAFIGAGVLGLPYAFKEAGILEGTFVMSVVAFLSIKAMLLLVKCKYRIIENWEMGTSNDSIKYDGLLSHESSVSAGRLDLLRSEELLLTRIKEPSHSLFPTMIGNQDISYGDVGYEAMGSTGRIVVDFTIVLSQFGFCCAYLIFICKNMSDMIHQVEMGHWLLIVLPALSLLTLFRHLSSLALTSLLAQCSVVLAFTAVFWFDFEHYQTVRIHPKEISFENLPFFFVIAVYCFEGAGLILSLEGSLAKEVRDKFPKYLTVTMIMVTILYISFGICGYLSFGTDTNQIITLNLYQGPGFSLSIIVKSSLCIALFLTYPVMMFPVMRILEHYFIPDAGKAIWKGNILRALVVLLTGMVVILILNFADLVALVGACCCTLLSFILPGLFHLCLFKGEMNLKEQVLDWLLIIIGVVGTIFGVWNSVVHISSTETASTADSLITSAKNVTESVIQFTTDVITRSVAPSHVWSLINTTTEQS